LNAVCLRSEFPNLENHEPQPSLPANQYVYDDENRIVSVSLYLGGTASYSYDAEGQRVRKAAGATVEEYVYDSAGHQFATMQSSGAMERIELYAGARHLATYDIASNATYFIHGDWQGTERLRTNAAGAAYESCTNLPFGDNQTCTGGADISPMHLSLIAPDVEYQQSQPVKPTVTPLPKTNSFPTRLFPFPNHFFSAFQSRLVAAKISDKKVQIFCR
jgi:YD repeat-containing protein